MNLKNLVLYLMLIVVFLVSCSNEKKQTDSLNVATQKKTEEKISPNKKANSINGTYSYGKYGKAIITQKGNEVKINFVWSNPKNNTSYKANCIISGSNLSGTVQKVKPALGKRDVLKGVLSKDKNTISLKGSGSKYGFNKISLKKVKK